VCGVRLLRRWCVSQAKARVADCSNKIE
jgi:hypothetical protein